MKIWVLFSNAPRRVPVFTPQVLIVFLAEEAPTVLVPLLPFEVLRHLGKQSGSLSLLLFAGESETSGLVFQSGFETQVELDISTHRLRQHQVRNPQPKLSTKIKLLTSMDRK